MALVKARTWINETFERGSRPKLAQVWEWIRAGHVPGKIVGNDAYVDADRFAVQSPAPKPEERSGLELLQ